MTFVSLIGGSDSGWDVQLGHWLFPVCDALVPTISIWRFSITISTLRFIFMWWKLATGVRNVLYDLSKNSPELLQNVICRMESHLRSVVVRRRARGQGN